MIPHYFSSSYFIPLPQFLYINYVGNSLLLIQPSQPTIISLGQLLRVDLYLETIFRQDDLAGPFASIEGNGEFTQDSSNPQHTIFEARVTSANQGFNEFFYTSKCDYRPANQL